MLHSHDALGRDRFGDPDPHRHIHDTAAQRVNLLQLNPPIAVDTPEGDGLAHILSDHGQGTELCWTVVMTRSGDIRTFSHGQISGFEATANASRMASA